MAGKAITKTDVKSIAQRMRDKINKNAGQQLTTDSDNRVQVEAWIEMRPDFQEMVGGAGLPQGHITQIYSEDPNSGKTTELISSMIACQKQGGVVNLIDSEHKFPWERLEMMGGDVEAINHIEADSLEEAWEAWDTVARSTGEMREEGFDGPIMAAWDSVPASIPDAIMNEKDAGKAHVAVEAKINNKNIRKLRQMIRRTKLTAVFINHAYWTMPRTPFERPKEVLKGGSEMLFMTTLAIRYKKGAKISRDITRTVEKEVKGVLKEVKEKVDQQIGQTVHAQVSKGHFSGKSIRKTFNIVEPGFVDEAGLVDYKRTIKGKL